MADFLMPILGADMTVGKIVAWRKKPGDRIERGEIIVEVETDKATVEVECYTSGTFEEVLVQEDQTVPVGTPLARIKADAGEGPPSVAPQQAKVTPPVSGSVVPSAPRASAVRLRISPAARQLAEHLHVDLSAVTPTGPGGRITREDIETAAADGKRAQEQPATGDRQQRMRQAIAASMLKSVRDTPHFHVTRDIDMSAALAWLTATNEQRPMTERLIYVVLLIKAVSLTLREMPDLNGAWGEGRVESKPDINVGLAISLRGGGLVAPALLKTDQRTVDDLMAGSRDLVQRARAGKLRGSELTDATVTITNLGELGADVVFGVIYPGQAALVGFGRVLERPVASGGEVVVRPIITATLTADHRVVDGHLGSAFLARLDEFLQDPEKL